MATRSTQRRCAGGGGGAAGAGGSSGATAAGGLLPGGPGKSEGVPLKLNDGHLDVLQWAREHDCPWNANECAQAADAERRVEVARWVRAQPAL